MGADPDRTDRGGRRDRARYRPTCPTPTARSRRRSSIRPRWPSQATPARRAADVPEADALEQQLVARPRGTGGPVHPLGDREADDADVLEQELDVPVEEDDPE